MIKGSKPSAAGPGEILWDILPSGKRASGARPKYAKALL